MKRPGDNPVRLTNGAASAGLQSDAAMAVEPNRKSSRLSIDKGPILQVEINDKPLTRLQQSRPIRAIPGRFKRSARLPHLSLQVETRPASAGP
jgi:hypothetical protein